MPTYQMKFDPTQTKTFFIYEYTILNIGKGITIIITIYFRNGKVVKITA